MRQLRACAALPAVDSGAASCSSLVGDQVLALVSSCRTHSGSSTHNRAHSSQGGGTSLHHATWYGCMHAELAGCHRPACAIYPSPTVVLLLRCAVHAVRECSTPAWCMPTALGTAQHSAPAGGKLPLGKRMRSDHLWQSVGCGWVQCVACTHAMQWAAMIGARLYSCRRPVARMHAYLRMQDQGA